jgi:hypothetical protein
MAGDFLKENPMSVYSALSNQKTTRTIAGPVPDLPNRSFFIQNTVYLSSTPKASGGSLLATTDIVKLMDLPTGVMPIRAWIRILTANDGAASATINVGVYKVSDDAAVDADGLVATADAKATALTTTIGAGAMLATTGFKPAAVDSYIGAAMAVACTADSAVPRVQVIVECLPL